MRTHAVRFIMLIFSLGVGTFAIHAQQERVWVIGEAVDEQGMPLTNTVAMLYFPPCRGCIDHVLETFVSSADGMFFLDATGHSKGLKLYIEEGIPSGTWSPFGARPYYNLSHLALFRGIPIYPTKSGKNIELGRVTVRLRYGKVKLDLPSLVGPPFKISNAKALKFTMRDSFGKTVYDGYLPDVAFDPTIASVNLALPPGKWFVNFSLGDGPQHINSPRVVIDVDKDRNAVVSLMRTNKFRPARRSS